jgi:hypothetical protein
MSSTATATSLTPPLTAHAFLFPDEEPGAGTGLSAALGKTGAAPTALAGVRRLPATAFKAVEGELGTVTAELLDIDLGDLVVLSWRKYSVLVEAARRTRAAPGTEEVVVLATHRVSSTYRPSVDVTVDNVKVNTFEFVLSVQIDIRGLSAVVRGGDLVALYGGDCLITATLTLEGARLAHREQTVDLRLFVPLRQPFALVDKAHHARRSVLKGGGMDSHPGDVPIAEPYEQSVDLVVQGEVVGEVDGLVWSDASGVEVVSITFEDSQIAVPCEPGEWRGQDRLDLAIDRSLLEDAPRLSDLRDVGGSRAIELVGDHFSVNLAGPPPGPNPGPLPPWWDKESTADSSARDTSASESTVD